MSLKFSMRRLTYASKALREFLSTFKLEPTKTEKIQVSNALKRVLAEDIIASRDIPPFDRAALDGYAIRAEDSFGASEYNPIRLRVIGESIIGKSFDGYVNHGEAVKIHTGAPIPQGANSVIMVEFTRSFGNEIEIYRSVAPNSNISRKGEDVKAGETVIKKGIRLESFDLALIKGLGYTEVKVRTPPKVAFFACGDELVDPHNIGELKPGKILETNREMLKHLVTEWGGEPIDLGILKDNKEEIKSKFEYAIKIADIAISIGGTSIGEHDLIPKVVTKLGSPGIVIHGVAVQPGKPVLLANIRNKVLIGLPGYPVSTYVAANLFLRPIIFRLLDLQGIFIPRTIKAIASSRIPSKPGLRSFIRVKLKKKNNQIFAYPISIWGAGILSSLSRADGFLVISEDKEGVEKGEEVDVILLRDFLTGVSYEEDL